MLNLLQLSFDSPADLDAGQASSFTFATIRFYAIGIGTSMLDIAINALGDALGEPLEADVSSGSIVINRASVPEPGTLGLLALGCAGLICLGRKRGYY